MPTFTGGPDNDLLIGTPGRDTLDGAGGNDTLQSPGVIGDRLLGGDGDDSLIGNAGDDTILGGEGDDIALGNAGDDFFFDIEGSNVFDGGAGEDVLSLPYSGNLTLNFNRTSAQNVPGGETVTIRNIEEFWSGTGNDRLVLTPRDNFVLASSGNDRVYGLGGDDTLHGDRGRDTILGGAGDDEISGGDGTDLLIGGAGADLIRSSRTFSGDGTRDILVGGDYAGGTASGDGAADVFEFIAVSDSFAGGATRDVIRDFEPGLDSIDLFFLDADSATRVNDAFTFIGTARFSGTAGELRYFSVGGNTYVRADVDGDGVADFELALNGTLELSAGDFVL